jgi:hypothetical protein
VHPPRLCAILSGELNHYQHLAPNFTLPLRPARRKVQVHTACSFLILRTSFANSCLALRCFRPVLTDAGRCRPRLNDVERDAEQRPIRPSRMLKTGAAPSRQSVDALLCQNLQFSNRKLPLLEGALTPWKQTAGPRSNRKFSRVSIFRARTVCPGPVLQCAAGTTNLQYLCSPPNFVCYSHRRTRVPPNGSRATAPARPSLEASRLLRCILRHRLATSLVTRPSPDSPRRFSCAF